MQHFLQYVFTAALSVLTASAGSAQIPRELRVGVAGHAFDHLGDIGNQAAAAATSGATIIYGTGLGAFGFQGLPPENELTARRDEINDYNRNAKEHGIRLAIGYVCATSIVKLDSFDRNWTKEFRAGFTTPPAQWRQVDRQGNPLPSWYGGDYQPACMNNPDWRRYQKFIVRQQLETGHDGIFFDNPTVHPQGCYCVHCMEKFAAFLEQSGTAVQPGAQDSPGKLEAMRQFANAHPKEFLRFRSTIARDFLAGIRQFAGAIKQNAFITCNNSLNSPDRLYAQCRVHGYNIAEMSKVEDWVVVEDMSSQPRAAANGQTFEYGPTYKQLHAISHGKPIVAVTLAGDDYHTAPNLVRLAMAEAAAHNASYLSWPTWPEKQRQRMISAIRPEAEFLRQNEAVLNDTRPRADVSLFLPFRRWVDTGQCMPTTMAAALTHANVQYEVVSEDSFFLPAGARAPVFLVESLSVLTPGERAAVDRHQEAGGRVVAADQKDWLKKVQAANSAPSLILQGPPTIRAVVRDQPARTLVHLYNLNVERLSSFEDKVNPATNIKMTLRIPFQNVRSLSIRTADQTGTSGPLKFTTQPNGNETIIELTIPRLEISAIVVIEM